MRNEQQRDFHEADGDFLRPRGRCRLRGHQACSQSADQECAPDHDLTSRKTKRRRRIIAMLIRHMALRYSEYCPVREAQYFRLSVKIISILGQNKGAVSSGRDADIS